MCVYRNGGGGGHVGHEQPWYVILSPTTYTRNRGPRRRRSLSARVLTAHISAQAGGRLKPSTLGARLSRGGGAVLIDAAHAA